MQSHGSVKISNYYRASGYWDSIIDSFLLQDYDDTDYPVTLPLRRPYSGDPGMLLVFLVEVFKSFLLIDPYTPATSLTQKSLMRKNLENLLPTELKTPN
jgi:hypothetical protein